MIDATAVALLLDELDYSFDLYECYGETYGQYRYEMGVYGDAWPGAFDQIRGLEEAIDEMRAIGDLVEAISPPWVSSFTPLTNEPF